MSVVAKKRWFTEIFTPVKVITANNYVPMKVRKCATFLVSRPEKSLWLSSKQTFGHVNRKNEMQLVRTTLEKDDDHSS